MLAVHVAQQVPGALAIEEVFEVHAAAGLHGAHHLLEQGHGLRAVGAGALHGGDELLHLVERMGMALAWRGLEVGIQMLVEVVLLEVHHVVRQLVSEGAVVRAAAAQEHQRKAVLGVGAQDLVDPA